MRVKFRQSIMRRLGQARIHACSPDMKSMVSVGIDDVGWARVALKHSSGLVGNMR
jgi:hypothetical protein